MDSIVDIVKPLYKSDSERIKNELETYAKQFQKLERKSDKPYWYKFITLQFIYPDGVELKKSLNPLQNLSLHMENMKDLGIQAVHVLPFLDSPMVDCGFDVKDYFTVRKNLGSMDDLKKMVKRAEELNLRLFMDLVLNHVSIEHEWFQKAQQGDKKYREYFLYSKVKPHFIRKFHEKSAVWAEFEVGGRKRVVNIGFPEFVREIPQWIEGKDGYWYYHTYYPEQPDLNWFNPDVFIEMGKIALYWASMGFNFRLDAIPFVGKKAYKDTDEDNTNTHMITRALKTVVNSISPECAFMVESYEDLKTVIDYFGTSNSIQADLSYNFHLTTNIWVSLIEKDHKFMWNKLDELDNKPKHAEWVNFLRNHDELSLAYLSDEHVKKVNAAILKNGAPFRENYGIAGRTFSLLGKNIKKFMMAYFLLASFPGSMVIPYGDEIGKENVTLDELAQKAQKDTRNINRGTIMSQEFNTKKAKELKGFFKYIIKKRTELTEYLHVWPNELAGDREIFGALYRLGTSEFVVLVNLCGESKRVAFDTMKEFTEIAHVNNAYLNKNHVHLGPYAGIWIQK